MDYYTLKIGDLERKLPIIKLSEDLSIASFVILGDTEIVEKTAPLIAEKLPKIDYIVTAEAKGVPLAYESKIIYSGKKKCKSIYERCNWSWG